MAIIFVLVNAILMIFLDIEPSLEKVVNSWNNKTLAAINNESDSLFIHARNPKSFYVNEYKNQDGNKSNFTTEYELRIKILKVLQEKYKFILEKDFFIIEARKDGEMTSLLDHVIYKNKNGSYQIITFNYNKNWLFVKHISIDNNIFVGLKNASTCQNTGVNSYFLIINYFKGVNNAVYSKTYPELTICKSTLIDHLNKMRYRK